MVRRGQNVNARVSLVAGPVLMTVQHGTIALRNYPLKRHSFAKVFPVRAGKMRDGSGLAVSHVRIVLPVSLTTVLLYCPLVGIGRTYDRRTPRRSACLLPSAAIGRLIVTGGWLNCRHQGLFATAPPPAVPAPQ